MRFESTTDWDADRDQYGRPLVKSPSGKGERYRRVTTFVKVLDDTFFLNRWKTRESVAGLVELGALGDLTGEADVTDRLLQEGLDARFSAAEAGTWCHALSEMHDRDGRLPFKGTEAELDWLLHYARVTEGCVVQAVEHPVVHDALRVAGTLDRLVVHEGKLRVLDVKTSKSLHYSALGFAAQLALYAHSALYDGGKRHAPRVDTEVGLIAHVPLDAPERAVLVKVDLRAGWEAVQAARAVWEVRKLGARSLLTGEAAVGPPVTVLNHPVEKLIDQTASEWEVRKVWADHKGSWTEKLSEYAKAHIATLAKLK